LVYLDVDTLLGIMTKSEASEREKERGVKKDSKSRSKKKNLGEGETFYLWGGGSC
jgi:hypothetical protein